MRRALLKLLCSLPDGLLVAMTGGPTVIDGQRMDGPSQLFNRLATNLGAPYWTKAAVDARADSARTRQQVRPPLEVSRLQDLTIDVEGGTIAARVFRPEAPTGAALVYFHGGGWVLGSVDGHAYPCSCLAARSGATVISVEYRLAPEHPYPVPVDDCYRAWQAVRQRAEELGIDPGRIAVGGDSAGGNLAAAVCLRAIARGEPRPAFQLLVYPATDLVEDAASVELFAEGFLLGRRGMIWFKDHYAPVERRREPECSPLLAPSLEAHPPAYVLLAGFDPLRDEGRAYAKRLEEAGVEVVLDEVPSSMHGFFNLGWYIPVADAAMHRAAEALREALG